MPQQEFKNEVDKYLTGASEPSELIYFKLYRGQVPVIEQALEIDSRMLGSDRSRGYCLEMICADFLAGPAWGKGTTESCWPPCATCISHCQQPNRTPSSGS